MSLSAAQLEARDGKLTASRVACLMTGDEAKILNLWRLMIGDPEAVEEDLSDVWPVQLGVCTEPLNLAWYARKMGPLFRQGEVVVHPTSDWAACTLDAWDPALIGPVEAKHVGGHEPLSRIIERYAPQLAWQMIVTGAGRSALTVIEGTNPPVVEIVDRDDAYAQELWGRACTFMECVWSLRPPVALEAVQAPVKAERIVDMAGSNSWASEAAVWLANREAKDLALGAEKALKGMVPADAARCHGFGVVISRNKAGSLSLREIK